MKINYAMYLYGLAIALLIAADSPARSQVLYSQTFDYSSAGSGSTSLVGWNAYAGSSAIDLSTAKTTTVAIDANSNATGGFSAKLFPSLGSPQATQGYLALEAEGNPSGGSIGINGAAVKTGLNLSNVGTITWQSSRNGTYATPPPTRLLVQVGSVWYASEATYTSATTYTGSDLNQRMASADSFSLSAATATTWRVLTLTPGSQLSLASTTTTLDLASSVVTGVGFYVEIGTRSNSVNYDTLVVSAVPEPGSLAALGFGVVGLMLVRRRRGVVSR